MNQIFGGGCDKTFAEICELVSLQQNLSGSKLTSVMKNTAYANNHITQVYIKILRRDNFGVLTVNSRQKSVCDWESRVIAFPFMSVNSLTSIFPKRMNSSTQSSCTEPSGLSCCRKQKRLHSVQRCPLLGGG